MCVEVSFDWVYLEVFDGFEDLRFVLVVDCEVFYGIVWMY